MGGIFRIIAIFLGVVLGIFAILGLFYGGLVVGLIFAGLVVVLYMPYYIILHLIESKEKMEKRIEELENLQVTIEDRDIEKRNGVYKYEI